MRFGRIFIFALALLLMSRLGVGQEPENTPEKRESILDRVVHIEPALITVIPPVSRWCDRLELRKERIDVGDAQLYVEEEGKGIPLVLINGGPGGTHHCFHPWFSRAKEVARVIYYDQRGCGLSDFKPGKEGYSVRQAIDDLDAVRIAKKIDKWVVLGYSYGGFLAQYYTVTYPEHVAGLILLGASPAWEDDMDSRQYMFISEKERARLEEIGEQVGQLRKNKNLSRKETIQILIYNNLLNGDWKRQNFYKPDREGMARIALYEWDNDVDFNSILNTSQSGVDLTGAFDLNPIPTLILEGKWDLTWSEEKPGIMQTHHPKAKLVIFEHAGHGIYDEDTEHFFAVLREFLQGLRPVSETDLTNYKQFLAVWSKEMEKKQKESPAYFFKGLGWGLGSAKKIVEMVSAEWLEKLTEPQYFLRTGFAFYDLSKYPEALTVFEKMQALSEKKGDMADTAVSLIWQGHILDLMGKRDLAIARYQKAADMNLNQPYMHGQYNLQYRLSPYALERTKTPFKRVENNERD